VRREVWRGLPWAAMPVIVVEDEPGLLVTYIAEGAPFAFPEGDWPGGGHPWQEKAAWRGNGALTLQRPGEAHGVWVFWRGRERRFAGWYVNLQAPFRRTAHGYDTLDHELDLWVARDGSWRWKDEELVERRVAEGRFTAAEARAIRAEGARVAAELDAGRRWWSDVWADWAPDPAWPRPALPADWRRA
jgi:hypothetical protein